jgi:hypothetical protein
MSRSTRDAAEAAPTMTISLHIVNTYELYPTVETRVTDAIIAGCPIGHLPRTDDEHEVFDDWAFDHIQVFTGVGHTDGDSFYDVTVTACSAAWLVGYTFAWGY